MEKIKLFLQLGIYLPRVYCEWKLFTQLGLSQQTSVAMVLAQSLSELGIQFQWQAQLARVQPCFPLSLSQAKQYKQTSLRPSKLVQHL